MSCGLSYRFSTPNQLGKKASQEKGPLPCLGEDGKVSPKVHEATSFITR